MHLDTLLGRGRGQTLRSAGYVGLMLAFAAIVLGSVMPLVGGTNLRATRRACDRVVDTLLTSRDPVELQRSGILIRELDCNVSSRLPREP